MSSEHLRHHHRLELEQRERGCEEGDAYEGEGWVGDVEDVSVQVVEHGAVCDENLAARLLRGRGIAVQVGEEGEGEVVACAEDYVVDLAEFAAGGEG